MSTWVMRVARGTRTRWWPEARAGTAQDVTKPGEDRGNSACSQMLRNGTGLANDPSP